MNMEGQRELNQEEVFEQQEPVIQEHPLLNQLVMSHLFSLMESTVTVKDLKNFRLVCSLWKESSQKVWRKVAPLKLGPPEESIRTRSQSAAAARRSLANGKDLLPVNTFLELMNRSQDQDGLNLKGRPFANYVLEGVSFFDEEEELPEVLKTLPVSQGGGPNLWNYFSQLGNRVNSVGFKNCILKTTRVFLEELLGRGLVHISKLTLDSNLVCPTHPLELFGQFFAGDFLSSVPKLRCLEIIGQLRMDAVILLRNLPKLEEFTLYKNYEYFCVDDLFIALGSLRSKFPEWECQLKKLDVLESTFFADIAPHSYEEYQEGLDRVGNLPLEYLSLTLQKDGEISIGNSLLIKRILQPLLDKCRETLKTLKVFRVPLIHSICKYQALFSEEMTSLEELYLYGNLVDNYKFLLQTPSLKVLHIDTACLGMIDHLKEVNVGVILEEDSYYCPFPKDLLDNTTKRWRNKIRLEHMTSVHLQCKVNSGTIRWLAKCMPNLKVFKAVIGDKAGCTMICKHMTGLEELGILRGSKVTEEMITGYYNKNRKPDPYRITNLKNLRRFSLMACCGQSNLTDFVVQRGLSEMETLDTVSICVSKNFSEEAEKILRAHVADVTIIRNTNPTCTGGWDCCVEAEFLKGLKLKKE